MQFVGTSGGNLFQTYDFGFSDCLLNLYDGNENVTGAVPCSPPLAAFTCGSELPTVGIPPSATYVISGAATASGGNTVYTGNIAYGRNNAYAQAGFPQTVTISGFTNAGNNVTNAPITASTPTTLTVTNSGGVSESLAFAGKVSVINASHNVTWSSGQTFVPGMVGQSFLINSAPYTVRHICFVYVTNAHVCCNARKWDL